MLRVVGGWGCVFNAVCFASNTSCAGSRVEITRRSASIDGYHHGHPLTANTMMDVTFVLEESGATATVEVPCDANVAEAKRVACTEFAVSPASVEVRVGTEVVEGTCLLPHTVLCYVFS